jgi:ferrochelatase
MTSAATQAVLLMTYGSPSSLEDLDRYLAAVRGGRPAEPELVAEFRRRYDVIGGSPLIPITIAQAAAVEERLADGTLVRAAMRFSEPSIATVVAELADRGVRRIAAIILSPQYSPLLMGGYARALDDATAGLPDTPAIALAGPWFEEPAFVAALADRVRDAVEAATVDAERDVPVLLTAHSLPRRVAEREPDYLEQLRRSAELVAGRAGLAPGQWTFCWQSAGHEPGEWMKPDFADLMPELRSRGFGRVVIAPIQFLADHLEILYDVDVGARQQATSAGLGFARIASLNTDPGLIDALCVVARRTLQQATTADGAPGVVPSAS